MRYQGLTAMWKENRSWSFFLTDLPYYVGAVNRCAAEVADQLSVSRPIERLRNRDDQKPSRPQNAAKLAKC